MVLRRGMEHYDIELTFPGGTFYVPSGYVEFCITRGLGDKMYDYRDLIPVWYTQEDIDRFMQRAEESIKRLHEA